VIYGRFLAHFLHGYVIYGRFLAHLKAVYTFTAWGTIVRKGIRCSESIVMCFIGLLIF
jgi:hypothetical protein